METPITLAVTIPAPCKKQCPPCRMPAHGIGNSKAVLRATRQYLPGKQEVLYTSDGDTGLCPDFQKFIDLAEEMGVPAAVLCSEPGAIVKGLVRAEISYSKFVRPDADQAINKAHKLGVPVVISQWYTRPVDHKDIADRLGADGVLIRAVQAEGKAKTARGVTTFWQRPGSKIGLCPNGGFPEFRDTGFSAQCLSTFGAIVESLSGRYVHVRV